MEEVKDGGEREVIEMIKRRRLKMKSEEREFIEMMMKRRLKMKSGERERL